MTARLGVLEWMEDTTPLKEFIKGAATDQDNKAMEQVNNKQTNKQTSKQKTKERTNKQLKLLIYFTPHLSRCCKRTLPGLINWANTSLCTRRLRVLRPWRSTVRK